MTSPSVGDALAAARRSGIERLDAQLLLAHVLGRSRGWLLAHDDAALSSDQGRTFETLLARRAAREPIAYLVGVKEFHGLALAVSPATLVPRPETELLVDWAIERLHEGSDAPEVLDLGTGSGAIALAIKRACPTAQVTAVDASEAALEVARRNGERLRLEVQWLPGDWCAGLGGRRFDLIVSNPPYVAQDDPHLVALRHEPRLALVAGSDGFDALRRIATAAPAHLRAGGWLLLEHGHLQDDAVRTLLHDQALTSIETRRDLAGVPRCTGGKR